MSINIMSNMTQSENEIDISPMLNDINKVFKSCKEFNIEISRIFNYEMNQKKMKIFFFRSPGGLIFEIIQYVL